MSSEFSSLWALDSKVTFLNHGSFGACPVFILEKQQEYRQMLENEPIRFMITQVETLLHQSKVKIAAMTGADADDLVFVGNATSGVNTVLRSLKFNPGDEIIFTNHIYGACRKALEFIRHQNGVSLVEAMVPFPVDSPGVIIEAIFKKITSRTRLLLIDHISSATALVHPVEILTKELENKGIEVLIDGAHAPGSIPLNIGLTGASYYTANCHKWLCAPKGAAILHVRKDKQKTIYPLTISHAGYDAESFSERFFWPGTWDPTAYICAGDAVEYMSSLMPDGWRGIMERNRQMCLSARSAICDELGIQKPCPDEMIASMATIPLPPPGNEFPHDYKSFSTLQENLFSKFGIEIPVWNWNQPVSRLTRIAVQLYNHREQYEYLGKALKELIQNERS